ncbi:MYND finger [Seminavis robusta]|uniref:MYND finger n=1 Tax=Seminavis robusta TaxID=568900 RepID=A0A9N8EB74_9STRA|nr:MYND finger [Seminavis robusta]|eukprot:Sro870_g213620.1 MYND finger (396) ;mRNA; r:7404-8591
MSSNSNNNNKENTMTTDHHSCSMCGKDSKTRCSQCQSKWYCGRECQKTDWKEHKKICFPVNSTCTRCLLPTSANQGICCVPHPEYLMEDMGSSFGPDGQTLSFSCKACGEHFSKVNKDRHQTNFSFQPAHAEWCFQGRHTVKPLKEGDERRICNDVATINRNDGDTTQQFQQRLTTEMDPSTVRILVIQNGDGFYDDTVEPVLDLHMPLLEELQLINVCFSKIVLNDAKTPRLSTIEMQNLPDECDMELKCSNLRDFNCRHHHGDCEWVQDMLDTTHQLVSFRTYKLGLDEVKFGPHLAMLKHIYIHRSDCLCDVVLGAPHLQYLRLQGCYSLESLKIKPKGGSRFTVETVNSNMSQQVIKTLKNSPRVMWDGDEVDEHAGVGGSPMEAMFRMMH